MREQFTIRVYDAKELRRIKTLHKDLEKNFPTTNNFLVYCLKKGLDTIEKDIRGIKSIQSFDELYEEITKTFARLNELIKISEHNTREIIANSTITQKLLCCNYNMLLGLSDKAPKSKQMVESGAYDDVPSRLDVYLGDVLDVFLKQDGKK